MSPTQGWSSPRTSILTAFLATSCLVQPAFAQTAEDTGDSGRAYSADAITDIVVTARKRAESVQDTPIAVSAISSQQLEEAQLTRVDDLQKTVPSLVAYNAPNLAGTPIFALRGVSTSDYIPTNENPVALYIDGVYVARQQGALFALEDLQRVEVLRGPQGTLNGRNATAGSISLYTKNPDPDFGLSQKVSYGTFNNFASATTVNVGALGNSGISVRASYYHNEKDGYVRNLSSSDKSGWPGALNEEFILAAVRGEWGNFTVDYKFDYDTKKGLGTPFQVRTLSPSYRDFLETYNPGVQIIQPEFQDALSFNPLSKSRDRAQGHSLNAVWELSPSLTLKSITGFRKINTTYQSVFAPLPAGTVGNVSTSPTGPFSIQPIEISNIRRVLIRQKQWSQEFQLLGNLDRLNYVAGLYWFREKAYETYGDTGSLFLAVLSPTQALYNRPTFLDFDAVAVSKAVFGQVSYTPPLLDDRMELTVGLRYTDDKKHLVQTNPAPGSSVVPIPRDVTRKDDNLSAEGSIKVRWTPDVMTYFRVAQAYKAGGFSPRDTTFSPNGYAAEKVLSFELGFKADLFDRHLRINADIYHSDFKNIQVNQRFTAAQGCLSSATCSTTVADGRAVYRGVEAEVTVLPVRGFELSGSLGYVDPEWKRLLTSPADESDISDAPGTVFGSLAKWTASGAAKYTIPMDFGDMTFRGAVSYHSKRYFNNQVLPTNNEELLADPGYTNISAQIILSELEMGPTKFTVTFYGDNLSGNHPVLQSIDAGVASGTSFGPGRTFGMSVKAVY